MQFQPPIQRPPLVPVEPVPAVPPVYNQPPEEAHDEDQQSAPKGKEDPVSLAYPFELLIFALVGYFWQSIPELLGFSPIIDNAFLLSVLITSCINLFSSFFFTSKDSFLPWAKGFAAHIAALWIAYIHVLFESVSQGSMEVCCSQGKATADFSKVQAAIFYDKMFMHQAIAAVTWACLTIILVIALLQVKSCHTGVSSIQDWFPRHTLAAAALLVVIHTAIFAMSPVTCKKFMEFGGVTLSFAIVAWLLSIDGGWIMRIATREEMPPEHWKRVDLVWFSVQSLLAVISLLFACVLVSVLGQRVSVSLVVFSSVFFLWFVSLFVKDYLAIRSESAKDVPLAPAQSLVVNAPTVPESMRMRGAVNPSSGYITALPVQTKKAR